MGFTRFISWCSKQRLRRWSRFLLYQIVINRNQSISQVICLSCESFVWISGDLFIDGKVIPRPQYRYNDREPSGRNRPRPRYDRRRETMQVERRQPFQRQNWGRDQRDPIQPPTSMDGQNTARSGVGDFSTNPGEFNRSNHW